eukprot:Blabericola_migrator_1__8043@NODE_412_length_8716_cov_285_566539_g325_i0_p1_GENE_NODE_412_length_8716_cov_285_566539_g325_i0NODE_412_length_8716_cov_285_566539_g325_i0_p1_ORF_typecomplete_len747_score139_73OPT/PF03169_15/2e91OPT/PF03169_15/5_2e03SPC25/PF06703_11/35SPC25/PF06703_11/39SPC25/PF06703_11/1_2e04SPC25/PF06703_11/6_6e02_NODE_412_length_8716_cov_285_566539_g325_i064668706
MSTPDTTTTTALMNPFARISSKSNDEQSLSRAGSVKQSLSIINQHQHESYPIDLNEGVPQFTLKALIAGVLSGTLCTFIAQYYGLKVGFQPSMNILGATVGYGLTIALMKLPIFDTKFTPQENAVIQTVSVAVYSVSSPAFGFSSGWLGLSREAYEVVGGPSFTGNMESDIVDVNWWRSLLWCFALFAFGFFIAFPIKNYYIIKKRLFFPSGTATSYIIETLHKKGGGSGESVSYLCKSFSLAFVINCMTWCFEGLGEFPIIGLKAAEFGWILDWDLGSFGIGMLLPFNTNLSMLLGGIIVYGILQPYIQYNKEGPEPDKWFDGETTSTYLGLYAYAMFSGLGVMIVQGAWSLIALGVTLWLEKRKEKKRIAAGRSLEGPQRNPGEELLSEEWLIKRDEIFMTSDFPIWIPAAGYLLFGALCLIILHFMLDTPWYQTLIALVIVPVFACSNIEGIGRTDWDVSSAYGKLVMFPIGAWNRGKSIIPSVAVCHATISGCSNSGALMQDFKTGYLLGASPTMMFYAQFIGSVFGCFISPSIFIMLRAAFEVPTADAKAFIQGRFGPIYRTLAIVATGSGFDALPKYCLWIAFAFLILSLVLMTLEAVLPERYAKYVPDPSAMSIGMLVGATVPMEFFIGGLAAYWWAWWDRETCLKNKAYVTSGTIAGSGVAVVLQSIMSIASVAAPIHVTYTGVNHPGVAAIVVGVIAIVIALAVLGCGLWHWFPLLRRVQETEETVPFNKEDEEEAV